MKLFKKAKKWLVSALCATLVFSGVSAVNALNVKAVEGGDAVETVEVSNDIQTIITALNATLKGNKYQGFSTAKYVKDYQMANGGTASGILVERPLLDSTATGISSSNLIPIELEFNVSNLTGNDSFFGVILSPSEAVYTLNGAALNYLQVGLIEPDTKNGFLFKMYADSDDNASSTKFVENGKEYGSLTMHAVSGGSILNESGHGMGIYYPNSQAYAHGIRGKSLASIHGVNKTPFNFYYDYETNVTYKDAFTAEPAHQSGYYRFAHMLNVSPKTYGSVDFDNKYSGTSFKNGASLTLKNSTSTATVYNEIKGFKNGKAKLALRIGSERQKTGTFLITNLMGLDLTNPANVFEDGIIVDEDKYVVANENLEVPAPKYETAIGNEIQKTFEGTVNVYKGERAYKYAYGSYGAEFANATAELGKAVETNLKVGATFTAEPNTVYTLEYIENGKSNFVTLKTYNKATVSSIDAVNTTITLNGKPFTTESVLTVGDVLKFTANDGYTLYNFTKEDTGNEAIVLNGNVVKLNENNEYVVALDDVFAGNISVVTASHSGKFVVTLVRLGGGSSSVASVYGGVESKYYAYYDSNAWRKATIDKQEVYTYYGLFDWNGAKARMINPLKVEGYSTPADKQLIGYSLTKTDDGTALGVLKSGTAAANTFPIHCNVTITPIEVKSFIQTSGIKTKGTAGLQIKVYIDKIAYDLMSNSFVKYVKGNELGYEQNQEQYIQAVVVKGDKYAELSEIVKTGVGDVSKRDLDDSYGWSTYAKVDKFKGNMSVVTISKFASDEEIEGVTYKVISLVLPGVSKEDASKSYYVGAFMSIGSCNGGGFLRIGKNGATSMIKHDYFTASMNSIQNVEVNPTDSTYKFSYVLGDMVFASNVYQSYEIEDIVTSYVSSICANFISLEEVDGYTKHATKDVWYDGGKFSSDVNVDLMLQLYELI